MTSTTARAAERIHRHFPFLDDVATARIFCRPPTGVAASDPLHRMARGLGATIYTPATQSGLLHKLRRMAGQGAVAAVVCLEDAIAIDELEAAEANLERELGELGELGQLGTAATAAAAGAPPEHDPLPLLFVRPRSPEHLAALAARLRGTASSLVGVCLPKFSSRNASAWFEATADASDLIERPLLTMPILEGPEVLYRETRLDELTAVRAILDCHRSRVLTVRIGGTDLCGLLGLRRSMDETVYDLAPIRDCIADIVNLLGRPDSGFVISGPVWEYFHRDARILKPQLRETLFLRRRPAGGALRSQLIQQHVDGLIREVIADRANGLWGKTVIHPSHIRAVNGLSVPTYEEWVDAQAVVGVVGGGAVASSFGNKMNEARPHLTWATRLLERAEVFGVLREGRSFVDLLDA